MKFIADFFSYAFLCFIQVNICLDQLKVNVDCDMENIFCKICLNWLLNLLKKFFHFASPMAKMKDKGSVKFKDMTEDMVPKEIESTRITARVGIIKLISV